MLMDFELFRRTHPNKCNNMHFIIIYCFCNEVKYKHQKAKNKKTSPIATSPLTIKVFLLDLV